MLYHTTTQASNLNNNHQDPEKQTNKKIKIEVPDDNLPGDLRFYNLKGFNGSELNAFKNLNRLTAIGCPNFDPKYLNDLPCTLEYLVIQGSSPFNISDSFFRNNKQLKDLVLENILVFNLETFKKLPNLERLVLFPHELTKAISEQHHLLAFSLNCTHLIKSDNSFLEKCLAAENIYKIIEKLVSTQNLKLSNCPIAQNIHHFLPPSVKYLTLEKCNMLEFASFAHLSKFVHNMNFNNILCYDLKNFDPTSTDRVSGLLPIIGSALNLVNIDAQYKFYKENSIWQLAVNFQGQNPYWKASSQLLISLNPAGKKTLSWVPF